MKNALDLKGLCNSSSSAQHTYVTAYVATFTLGGNLRAGDTTPTVAIVQNLAATPGSPAVFEHIT